MIAVGYKLTKPEIFIRKYRKGWAHLIPFVITILAILFTDLLIGIGIGLIMSALFIIWGNFRSAISQYQDGNNLLVRAKKDLSFIHKYELKNILAKVPDGTSVMIDLSRIGFVDMDNIDIINEFIESAEYRGISINFKHKGNHSHPQLINKD